MSRQLTKLTSIYFALLILVLVGGCSDDDCPTCPKDETVETYKGFLYYVELNPQLYDVYVVDMETDSIVDSIDVPDEPTGFLDVSSDGQYLAVTSSPLEDIGVHCYLYDAQTREFIRELPDRMVPFFDLTNNLVVGNVPVENGEYRGLRVLSYPSFSLIYEDLALADYSVYVIDRPRHKAYLRAGDQLFSYDYIARELKHHPIVDEVFGDVVSVFQFCINSTGTRLYFKAGAVSTELYQYEFVGAFDLESETLLWQKSIRGPWGGIGISPDDREIYANEVGELHGRNPGVLFVLDANTGAQLHAYSLYGWQSNPFENEPADEIVFSPSGDKLYIGGGKLFGAGSGSLALFDPHKRELVKFITPDFQRAIGRMAIGPKL